MPLSSVVGASSILRPGVCTSTSRPASPFEGQTIYETDTDQLLTYNGSGWKPFADVTASTNGAVLQIVSTAKTDTFSTTSTSFTDVTGLSVSITPSSTASKIFVFADVKVGGPNIVMTRILRDSTVVNAGAAAGNRSLGLNAYDAAAGAYTITSHVGMFVDGPSSTSALTYKIQLKSELGSASYVNRPNDNTDSASVNLRAASNITVMEISG